MKLLVQFQVYNDDIGGTYAPGDSRVIAVRADAITAIESPADRAEEGTPTRRNSASLVVGDRVYALAESWEHAVEKWEDALAEEQLNWDDDDPEDDELDELEDDAND